MITTEMLSRIQQAGEAGADSWSLFNLTETGSILEFTVHQAMLSLDEV